MNTELYKQLLDKLIDSGLSKRKFCEAYNIPHSWFIEFINPEKPFRPMQIKTIALIHKTFDIDVEVMNAYNDSLKGGE